MTDLEALRAMRELLAVRSRWTKGAAARDKYGHRVSFRSPRAARHCLMGAVFQIGGNILLLDSVLPRGDSMIAFNDTHTHAEVLALLDEAIALEEAKA